MNTPANLRNLVRSLALFAAVSLIAVFLWFGATKIWPDFFSGVWQSEPRDEGPVVPFVVLDAGHGGMDFLMNYRLFQCFNQGTPPEMDVYDAAAWSAPGPLSELSAACGNMPLPFPDFTRGDWHV